MLAKATATRLTSPSDQGSMVSFSVLLLGLAQASNPVIMARPILSKDFAMRCPAGEDTNELNCKLPSMWAESKTEDKLSVTTRIFLIDAGYKPENMEVDKVDYSKKATYLYKIDALDSHGNKAKQVSFALYLTGNFLSSRVYILLPPHCSFCFQIYRSGCPRDYTQSLLHLF